MKLIDRYIVFFFVRVFLICFLTLLGLFLVGDIVGNLAELLRVGKTHGGLFNVLLDYYGPKVPWFFDLMSRIAALIAAIYTVTWLQKHNELAALMAAGVSRWRIVKPLLGCVAVIAILAAANREVVLPRLAKAITRDAKNYGGERAEELTPRYDYATAIFFAGAALRAGIQEIEKPSFRLPRTLATSATHLIAERALYQAANETHPAGFLMKKVTEPKNVHELGTLRLADKPLVFGPRDNPWLGQDELFVATDLPFSHLREGNAWRRFSSTASLIKGAMNPSLFYGADVSVAIHSRIIQPALDLVLFFLAVPIVLSRESKNAFVAVGSCMLMVMTFLVFVVAMQSLGANYVIQPVALAVWAPLLVFVPLAVLMSEPLRR
jgi:lipopolysaccharide export system permease protein